MEHMGTPWSNDPATYRGQVRAKLVELMRKTHPEDFELAISDAMARAAELLAPPDINAASLWPPPFAIAPNGSLASPGPPEARPPANPKQAFGDKKPPLDEFPLSAMIAACLAGLDGDNKYGFRNWRTDPVEARTYIKGALRHLRLFEEGEDMTRDSKVVHNLGAVMMGCAILYDSQLNGTMIDNRFKSQAACDLLHAAEDAVAHLNDLHVKRLAAKAATAAESPLAPVASSAGADTTAATTPTPFMAIHDTESGDPLNDIRPEAERRGLPTHAYYAHGSFYHRATSANLGQEFYLTWRSRSHEFPSEPWGPQTRVLLRDDVTAAEPIPEEVFPEPFVAEGADAAWLDETRAAPLPPAGVFYSIVDNTFYRLHSAQSTDPEAKVMLRNVDDEGGPSGSLTFYHEWHQHRARFPGPGYSYDVYDEPAPDADL